MPVLLTFLLWPPAEIAVFVLVGGEIGAFKTVLLTVLSVILGVVVVRRQGLAAVAALRGGGPPPAGEVLGGLAVTVAGLLLIVPGFLSDIVGLVLLIPGVRQGLGALLVRHIARSGGGETRFYAGRSPPRPSGGGGAAEVIDVDFTEVKPREDEPSRRLEDLRRS